jgi:predicted transcriptional regulator of viral defense system
MATKKVQPWSAAIWKLVRDQHGVVARRQLLAEGMSSEAIRHRLGSGRLHRLARGVYAVGRPDVSHRGRWMAAVLACGPDALLSHHSGAELWNLLPRRPGAIDVSVPIGVARRRPEVRVHRKVHLDPSDRRVVDGIPVTEPVTTLVDLATCVSLQRLESAVNEADRLDLIDPETLRDALESHPRRPGIRLLRKLLDRHTFALTQSQLERYFLAVAKRAGMDLPQTQVWLNHHRVDFFWPNLGLVVETDGLRYQTTARRIQRVD